MMYKEQLHRDGIVEIPCEDFSDESLLTLMWPGTGSYWTHWKDSEINAIEIFDSIVAFATVG